jgi:hypothetical protein
VFDFIRFFLGLFLWVFTACIAFWRGRWPERSMAAVTLVLMFLEPVVQQVRGGGLKFDWGVFMIDLVYFCFLGFLAVRGNRIWTVVAFAFQAVVMAVHLVVFVNHPKTEFVYRTMTVLAGYLVLFAFQGGLVENEFRRRAERKTAAKFREPA